MEATNDKHFPLDQEWLDLFYSITPELFYEYLKEKGVKSVTCQICSNEKMGVTPQIGGKWVDGKPAKDNSLFVPPIFMPCLASVINKSEVPWDFYYSMQCSNCGYTHWFLALSVIQWLEFRRDSESNEA